MPDEAVEHRVLWEVIAAGAGRAVNIVGKLVVDLEICER